MKPDRHGDICLAAFALHQSSNGLCVPGMLAVSFWCASSFLSVASSPSVSFGPPPLSLPLAPRRPPRFILACLALFIPPRRVLRFGPADFVKGCDELDASVCFADKPDVIVV